MLQFLVAHMYNDLSLSFFVWLPVLLFSVFFCFYHVYLIIGNNNNNIYIYKKKKKKKKKKYIYIYIYIHTSKMLDWLLYNGQIWPCMKAMQNR